MFSRVGQLIFDNEAVAKTSDFTMGIEIEMQRVDEAGNLSKEPYPTAIGDEKTNPSPMTFWRQCQKQLLHRPNMLWMRCITYMSSTIPFVVH